MWKVASALKCSSMKLMVILVKNTTGEIYQCISRGAGDLQSLKWVTVAASIIGSDFQSYECRL